MARFEAEESGWNHFNDVNRHEDSSEIVDNDDVFTELKLRGSFEKEEELHKEQTHSVNVITWKSLECRQLLRKGRNVSVTSSYPLFPYRSETLILLTL